MKHPNDINTPNPKKLSDSVLELLAYLKPGRFRQAPVANAVRDQLTGDIIWMNRAYRRKNDQKVTVRTKYVPRPPVTGRRFWLA